MENELNKKHKNQVPISDGDSRPDKGPNAKKLNTEKQKKKAVTENRKGDTNSMDDYKDAL